MVLATADGHPLANALISRIPAGTLKGIEGSAFFAALLTTQGGRRRTTSAQFQAAKASARALNIGWVLVSAPGTLPAAATPGDRLPAGPTRPTGCRCTAGSLALGRPASGTRPRATS